MDRETARMLAFGMGSACLGLRVRLLMRVVTPIYEEALRPLGVTVTQFHLLAAIAWLEPTTASKLCGVIHLDRSSASRMLPLLREHGWIAEGSVLKLTAKGRRILKKCEQPWAEAQARLRGMLGDEDAEMLSGVVERLWGKATGNPITAGGLEQWRQ
ncbi:MAG: MarR family winged helix-turn-helix transcriptional regulator [Planctomycetota bacterium]